MSFAVMLGEGISEDYGDNHLVSSEPSYDEAARLAGYFDSDGVYQGGLAQWDDWSEDSYTCESVSGNGKYCQRWGTERYYADPEAQFLKGNCTCVRPLADTVDSTFGISINDWYSGIDDGETTSSSEAALEVCVEYDCVYIETNLYTACDCDIFGLRREEWGPDWWREYTHCDEFTCHHGNYLVTLNESFALASSATETSLLLENISSVPINPSIVSESLEYGWQMDYRCTQECFAGIGILLGGAIMVGMAPLFAAGCRGHYWHVSCSAPLALAASGLLAAFFGGWYAVWGGMVPGTVIAVILGGYVSGN
ncbi:unnamed protein product [Ectocarpus sp. 6 AP-2014]